MASRHPRWLRALGSLTLVIGLAALFSFGGRALVGEPPRAVSYSELEAAFGGDRVARAEVGPDSVVATLRGDKSERIVASRIPNMDERDLLASMSAHGVVVEGKHEGSSWTTWLWIFLPLVFLPLLWLSMSRVGADGRSGPAFGRSKAKIYERRTESRVRFVDVAGIDEAKAELAEVIQFLRNPAKYRDVGARVPKGVLLVGAPGTGKTLLARAVAGEAEVPFFSISGSEFVEMFVGVGASRVRDLFEVAKRGAPCIIFIDELDAVGKARSGPTGFASNEEREQTLNQLLVEMDGFDANSGLVILAATNRPEILDRALLRAGRFDRQVVVDRPDVRGREAILAVHVRRVKLGVSVDLHVVAQRTPGMVGADLANVVNEAALASVRRAAEIVEAQDFEEAIDRIQLGLKRSGCLMGEAEKRRVAIHEAGHALVALSTESADPVHRVTIIPRSVGALGATLQLPAEERYTMTRGELRDRICVLLAGRVAEEIAAGDVSSGAEDDLERATDLARHMVCRLGMSDALGPIAIGASRGGRYLPWQDEGRSAVSEDTSKLADVEIKAILVREQARARSILGARRTALDAIARELVIHETLQGADLEALVAASASPARGAAA